MKTLYLIPALIAFSTVSCKKCEDAKLTIPFKTYTGTELRIDGYYYYLSEESLKNKDTFYHVFIPFSDGRMLNTGTSTFSALEENFTNGGYEQSKSGWGAFKIEGSVLTMEYWGAPWLSCNEISTTRSTILTDTTFILNNAYYPDQPTQELNRVYHFKYCTTRPNINPEFYK